MIDRRVEDGKLIIGLGGRIDSTNAADFGKELRDAISGKEEYDLLLSAEKLDYISSAGLREFMKLKKAYGKDIVITEVSPDVYEIFDTTGFTELFDVRKRMREVSVDGCEVIGEGGNGIVYKKDEETIVKVYYGARNSLEKIRRNQKVTKDVFVHGVPTAIAFDVVRVGENYGVVYEMIHAKSMMQEMNDHPENIEKYANMIADTLLQMHKTELEKGSLQDARDNARNDINAIYDSGNLSDAERDKLYKLIEDIPERNTFIHQDFHPGNMMYQDGEIVLIDVEDSGLGHPVLDLSSMYLVYVTAAKSGWTKKFGNLGKKEFAVIWDIIIRKYFDTEDKNEIKEINRILKGYSGIKFLRGIATSPSVPDFLRKLVIGPSKKSLMRSIDTLHPIP